MSGYLEVVRVLGGLVEGVCRKPLPDLDDVRNVHAHVAFLVVGDLRRGDVCRHRSRWRGGPLPLRLIALSLLLLPRPSREKEVGSRGRHVADAEGLHVQLEGWKSCGGIAIVLFRCEL